MGVPIDCVSGTSAGALAGAVFLAGKLDLIEELVQHIERRQLTRLTIEGSFPRAGLLTGRNVERFIKEMLQTETFAALERPLAVVATDLNSHQEVVISDGPLLPALRASISIPGVFTPAKLGGRDLVDGALVNPLPVSVLRAMGADIVIAVDVNLRPGAVTAVPEPAARKRAAHPGHDTTALDEFAARIRKHIPQIDKSSAAIASLTRKWTARRAEPSIFEVLTQASRIFENQLTSSRLDSHPPDILIQPAVGDVATLDYMKSAHIAALGAAAADERRADLEALLERVRG